MSKFLNYRDESRKGWGTEGDGLTRDQIQTGALLRIADATELMAKTHADLAQSRDYYKKRFEEELAITRSMRKANAALRGHIGRLKKSLDASGVLPAPEVEIQPADIDAEI